MSRDAKKVKQECEFMMPVSVRSADRVANGNKYAGKTDVGFTVGVAQIAKKVEKTTQFWDLARSYQKSIEESVKPDRMKVLHSLMIPCYADALEEFTDETTKIAWF